MATALIAEISGECENFHFIVALLVQKLMDVLRQATAAQSLSIITKQLLTTSLVALSDRGRSQQTL